MSWQVRFYTPQDADVWNDFAANCKNATFMHSRRFMDYHMERFTDASLLIFYQDKLFALLPANSEGDIIVSHRGLSYGGLLLNAAAKVKLVGACWQHIVCFLTENGYRELLYKAVPSFYHQAPAFEDLFWLRWHYKAVQIQTDMGAVIDLSAPLLFSNRKKRNIAKAHRNRLYIRDDTTNLPLYWTKILTPNLQTRHGVNPVHHLAEMELLMSRFPANIQFYGVYQADDLIAGTVLFITQSAVHAQYIAANTRGKELGALDLLFSHLLEKFRASHRYFSFGISTYNKGQALNEGLAQWKEEFGARTWLHETLLLQLSES
ncbi:MAG: GNAT family N-acetyltransferase [Cytophagales bacterium]|nr:GNAT family N-acetyltransferase [Bernardetiaceae bacterium]MDW8205555.1 GNAT family N-acetyltransferase [Cytophagales bacterium]